MEKGHTSISPPTDRDVESNVSPPREMVPAPPIAILPYNPILRLPTRWSYQAIYPLLSVSADGRDLTYSSVLSSLTVSLNIL